MSLLQDIGSGAAPLLLAARRRRRGASGPGYSVTVTDLSEIEILLSGEMTSGLLSIDLTASPPPFNGVYALSVADLLVRPVGVAAAPLTGTPEPGAVLGAIPDLFATLDGRGDLERSYQWYSHDPAGETPAEALPIAGAVAPSYRVQPGDAGRALCRASRASDASGLSEEVRGAAVLVPGGPAMAVTLAGSGQITATGAGPYTLSALSFGAPDPARVIYAVLAYGHQATGAGLTGVTISGQPTVPVAEALSGKSGCNVQIRKVVLPEGESGDVTVSMASNFRGCAVTLYRAVGAIEADIAFGTNTAYQPVDLSIDLAAGGVVLAGAMLINRGTTGAIGWNGAAETVGALPYANRPASVASFGPAPAAGTPHVLVMTPIGDGINDVAAVAVALQGA